MCCPHFLLSLWPFALSTWSYFLWFSCSNLEFPVPAWQWTVGSRYANCSVSVLLFLWCWIPHKCLIFKLYLCLQEKKLRCYINSPIEERRIIFLIFLSLLCLSQETLLNSTWEMLDNKTKTGLESQLNCCGLLNTTASKAQFDQDVVDCPAVSCVRNI